jgi:hypothetical protein
MKDISAPILKGGMSLLQLQVNNASPNAKVNVARLRVNALRGCRVCFMIFKLLFTQEAGSSYRFRLQVQVKGSGYRFML